MRLSALAIPLCIIGCASAPVQQTPAQKAEPATLELPQCPDGELSGIGIGETEGEALSMAHSDLAKRISSSIKVTTEYAMNRQSFNGREDINSKSGTQIREEAALANVQDARIAGKKQSGSKTGVAVCMSKADAAKPYIQRQSLWQDSLEFVVLSGLKAAIPRQKSEARDKANLLWAKMLANNDVLRSLGIDSGIGKAKDFHDSMEDDYKEYCQTAKLHWNPEQETVYPEIAFAKLSKGLKLEKSPCKGHGISLIYKNIGHKCDYAGLYKCSHKPSLLIASCGGTEYRLLEEQNAETFQKKEETATEKLQEKLKDEAFWGKWEQEIKQWSPQCE
ncbi:MAG: hypothetical protein LBH25_13680 [Fibromonadaceae bacterium]|jgi:hypothetical protein|nr:hypothetical protein [Fibromonadaceae bacterium]